MKGLHELSPDQPVLIVWDGASYHHADSVKEQTKSLSSPLEPLPAYSPDFMPIEAQWRWLRENVTYSHCHATCEELI